MADPFDPFRGLKLSGGWLGRFLCSRGYHKWEFLWMADPQMVSAERWTINTCTISDRCRRPDCRLRRVRKNAPIPKKVRT